ncbi:hypothetical protein LC653_45170, partial [Nostoc sp. CHAB 5784]|uniref:hypothetical protein n=1 Tax=Nostoc mirabile TaxID=2907820 RepID=UPI001E4A1A01
LSKRSRFNYPIAAEVIRIFVQYYVAKIVKQYFANSVFAIFTPNRSIRKKLKRTLSKAIAPMLSGPFRSISVLCKGAIAKQVTASKVWAVAECAKAI